MAKTRQNFVKEEALHCLIDLKATASPEKHERFPHFSVVHDAMKHKMLVPPGQFRRYLVALLGDKAQERVFDIVAKVDKTLKFDGELSYKRDSYERRPQIRQPAPCRYGVVTVVITAVLCLLILWQ